MDNNYMHILIVEDSKADLFLIKNFLSTEFSGKLDAVQDGEEALNFLYKQDTFKNSITPNLIILDLNLPKVNGKEVLAKVKADKYFCSIPVIIFSSSRNKADIEECYSLGANSYLVKPFGLSEYENVINTIKKYWVDTAALPKTHSHIAA